jgi:rare lipoprotein A
MIKHILFLFTTVIILSSCSSAVRFTSEQHPTYGNYDDAEIVTVMYGKASYYADKFEGRATSSGETFRNSGLTAAHKSLPFGTLVRVTNLENNKQVVVKINDRGPFVAGRVIDLSKKAAEEIDMIRQGVVEVKLEVLK